VLQALARPAAALAEMARVLRPGGRLVAETLNPWSPLALTRRVRSRLGGEPLRVRYGGPRGVERALAAAGVRPLHRVPVFLPPRSAPGFGGALGRPWIARALTRLPGASLGTAQAFWIVGERV